MIQHAKKLVSISMHINVSAIFGTQFQSKKNNNMFCTLHHACTMEIKEECNVFDAGKAIDNKRGKTRKGATRARMWSE